VQIAKALGAHVTAVCSTPNVAIAQSLGADRVIDYTQDDFTRDGERYDLVLDVAGTRPFSTLKSVLEPSATVVVVGGPRANRLLGPIGHLVGARLAAVRTRQKVVFFLARFDKADLATLRELLEDGSLMSVIDSVFSFGDIGDALEHMGSGHPRGKIVVTM
jgi:NADPH:quinone reductase-like Zn-dependent oxidoreductase